MTRVSRSVCIFCFLSAQKPCTVPRRCCLFLGFMLRTLSPICGVMTSSYASSVCRCPVVTLLLILDNLALLLLVLWLRSLPYSIDPRPKLPLSAVSFCQSASTLSCTWSNCLSSRICCKCSSAIIHDFIHLKSLLDDEGNPTTPFYLATGQKPAMKHFHIFGCPAVFKCYEVTDIGKWVRNKYTQQGI